MTKQELHAAIRAETSSVLCPDPKPRRPSRPMTGSSRPAIPAPIRWWPGAAAASAWKTWTATSFSTLRRASPSVSTGHCHPEVVAAIQKQAAELIHISGTDFYNEPLTDLADRLSAIAPMPGPHKFFYGNSGAEAIECALKLARYHTGRQHIIAFLGAFHGRTMGALSLTGSKPQQKRRFCAAGSRA